MVMTVHFLCPSKWWHSSYQRLFPVLDVSMGCLDLRPHLSKPVILFIQASNLIDTNMGPDLHQHHLLIFSY